MRFLANFNVHWLGVFHDLLVKPQNIVFYLIFVAKTTIPSNKVNQPQSSTYDHRYSLTSTVAEVTCFFL